MELRKQRIMVGLERDFMRKTYPHIFVRKPYYYYLKDSEFMLSYYMLFYRVDSNGVAVGRILKLSEVFNELPEETQIIFAYHLDLFP
jgi:hypothetical protein